MAISLPRNGAAHKSSPSVVHALLYTRVSKDEQAREGLSLDAQLADCRRYAAMHGWIIGNEYTDVMSGRRDDRPGYQELLAEVRQRRASGQRVVVVVKWLHRFGRRVLERVARYEELKRLGVAVHSVAEGGEVPEVVANMLAAIAQEESRQLSERVQSVNRHLARNGWARPGRCTWGYRWRPPTDDERASGSPRAVLDVDPETAPFAQEAYRRAAEGASVRGVLRWVQSLPTSARGGKRLNHRSMYQILTSPTYIACIRVDGELVEGRWPPLVDRETWERVQQRIASHERMPHQASGRYLLTGLLRCPQCGARMNGTINSRVAVYRCSGIIGSRPESVEHDCHYTTGQGVVNAAVLEQVSAIVNVVTSKDPTLQAAIRTAWRQLQQPAARSDLAHRIRQLERERDRAQERLKKVALQFVDGEIDRAGYELVRDQAQADLEAAEAELERISGAAPATQLPPLDDLMRQAGTWGRVLAAASTAKQRDVLGQLIEHVTPVRIGYGKYDVQITWTPLGESLARLAGMATDHDVLDT